MPRVWTPLYLLAIILGLGLSTVLTVWGVADSKVTELLAFSWMPLILVTIAICVLQYKCWAAIQDGNARTSPAAAVGLLFVPFFNLYWIFQVWYGFAIDYNNYVERHRLVIPKLPAGLYLTYCVLVVLSVVPFINLVTGVLSVGVLLFVVYYSCQAINLLADAEPDTEEGEEGYRVRRPATPSLRRVSFLVGAILLALTGVALVGLFLPSALESRRIWLYQLGQLDAQQREMKELEQRQDPASQIRLQHLREQSRTWHPEIYRDEYQEKMLIVGVGVMCLGLAGGILLVRWLDGRRNSPAEVESGWEQKRARRH